MAPHDPAARPAPAHRPGPGASMHPIARGPAALRMALTPRPGDGGEGTGPGDGEFVRLVRGGDTEAFRFLVRRHQARLFRYAYRMTGDPDTAMDLVQGALIQAHDRIAQCREPDRFGHWVLAILANACRHQARRQRRHLPLDEVSRMGVASHDAPGRDAERSELRALLDRALRRLPVEQREAFLLRHVEGLSYDDMAPVAGATATALRQRVRRARAALEALLEEAR